MKNQKPGLTSSNKKEDSFIRKSICSAIAFQIALSPIAFQMSFAQDPQSEEPAKPNTPPPVSQTPISDQNEAAKKALGAEDTGNSDDYAEHFNDAPYARSFRRMGRLYDLLDRRIMVTQSEARNPRSYGSRGELPSKDQMDNLNELFMSFKDQVDEFLKTNIGNLTLEHHERFKLIASAQINIYFDLLNRLISTYALSDQLNEEILNRVNSEYALHLSETMLQEVIDSPSIISALEWSGALFWIEKTINKDYKLVLKEEIIEASEADVFAIKPHKGKNHLSLIQFFLLRGLYANLNNVAKYRKGIIGPLPYLPPEVTSRIQTARIRNQASLKRHKSFNEHTYKAAILESYPHFVDYQQLVKGYLDKGLAIDPYFFPHKDFSLINTNDARAALAAYQLANPSEPTEKESVYLLPGDQAGSDQKNSVKARPRKYPRPLSRMEKVSQYFNLFTQSVSKAWSHTKVFFGGLDSEIDPGQQVVDKAIAKNQSIEFLDEKTLKRLAPLLYPGTPETALQPYSIDNPKYRRLFDLEHIGLKHFLEIEAGRSTLEVTEASLDDKIDNLSLILGKALMNGALLGASQVLNLNGISEYGESFAQVRQFHRVRASVVSVLEDRLVYFQNESRDFAAQWERLASNRAYIRAYITPRIELAKELIEKSLFIEKYAEVSWSLKNPLANFEFTKDDIDEGNKELTVDASALNMALMQWYQEEKFDERSRIYQAFVLGHQNYVEQKAAFEKMVADTLHSLQLSDKELFKYTFEHATSTPHSEGFARGFLGDKNDPRLASFRQSLKRSAINTILAQYVKDGSMDLDGLRDFVQNHEFDVPFLPEEGAQGVNARLRERMLESGKKSFENLLQFGKWFGFHLKLNGEERTINELLENDCLTREQVVVYVRRIRSKIFSDFRPLAFKIEDDKELYKLLAEVGRDTKSNANQKIIQALGYLDLAMEKSLEQTLDTIKTVSKAEKIDDVKEIITTSKLYRKVIESSPAVQAEADREAQRLTKMDPLEYTYHQIYANSIGRGFHYMLLIHFARSLSGWRRTRGVLGWANPYARAASTGFELLGHKVMAALLLPVIPEWFTEGNTVFFKNYDRRQEIRGLYESSIAGNGFFDAADLEGADRTYSDGIKMFAKARMMDWFFLSPMLPGLVYKVGKPLGLKPDSALVNATHKFSRTYVWDRIQYYTRQAPKERAAITAFNALGREFRTQEEIDARLKKGEGINSIVWDRTLISRWGAERGNPQAAEYLIGEANRIDQHFKRLSDQYAFEAESLGIAKGDWSNATFERLSGMKMADLDMMIQKNPGQLSRIVIRQADPSVAQLPLKLRNQDIPASLLEGARREIIEELNALSPKERALQEVDLEKKALTRARERAEALIQLNSHELTIGQKKVYQRHLNEDFATLLRARYEAIHEYANTPVRLNYVSTHILELQGGIEMTGILGRVDFIAPRVYEAITPEGYSSNRVVSIARASRKKISGVASDVKPSDQLEIIFNYTPSEIQVAYSRLGLTPSASPKEVISAFRELSLAFHPDKLSLRLKEKNLSEFEVQQASELAKALYTKIVEAKSVIASAKHYSAEVNAELNSEGHDQGGSE